MILFQALFMRAVINITKTEITFSELPCYLGHSGTFKSNWDAAGKNLYAVQTVMKNLTRCLVVCSNCSSVVVNLLSAKTHPFFFLVSLIAVVMLYFVNHFTGRCFQLLLTSVFIVIVEITKLVTSGGVVGSCGRCCGSWLWYQEHLWMWPVFVTSSSLLL